jgi:hypothetical protein
VTEARIAVARGSRCEPAEIRPARWRGILDDRELRGRPRVVETEREKHFRGHAFVRQIISVDETEPGVVRRMADHDAASGAKRARPFQPFADRRRADALVLELGQDRDRPESEPIRGLVGDGDRRKCEVSDDVGICAATSEIVNASAWRKAWTTYCSVCWLMVMSAKAATEGALSTRPDASIVDRCRAWRRSWSAPDPETHLTSSYVLNLNSTTSPSRMT